MPIKQSAKLLTFLDGQREEEEGRSGQLKGAQRAQQEIQEALSLTRA